MTPELDEIARRLVACEQWRWMPGMRASDGHRLDKVDCDGLHPDAYGVLPDLTDPATCGCLLAMLGRHFCAELLVVCHVSEGDGWAGF